MNEYTKVTLLDNEFEAQLLESILTERGVPHLLRTYHDTAFNGLFQAQKGWGHVSAPAGYHDEIREVIDDIRSGGDEALKGKDV
jgi:hypothetical protein